MRACTRIIAAMVIAVPATPAFVVPQFRGRRAVTIPTVHMPPSRHHHASPHRRIILMARRNGQDENIEKLESEIDAAIRQREELRQELEQEIRSFSERYERVNRNLQSADSRLEEETRSFQQQLLNEKKVIDGMDEIIQQKTQELETAKASGGFLQEAFDALNGLLQGALAPVEALSVVALVGEAVLRERKRDLEEEKARIRRQRLAEAEARQQVSEEPLPGYATASLAIGGIGLGLFVMTFLVGIDDSAVNTNTPNAASLVQEQQVTVVPKAGTKTFDEKSKRVEKSVEAELKKMDGPVGTRNTSPKSLPETPSQTLAKKDEPIIERQTTPSSIPKKEEKLRIEESKRQVEVPPETKTEVTSVGKREVPKMNRAEEIAAPKVEGIPKVTSEEKVDAAQDKTPTVIKKELPAPQPSQQTKEEAPRISRTENRAEQAVEKPPIIASEENKVQESPPLVKAKGRIDKEAKEEKPTTTNSFTRKKDEVNAVSAAKPSDDVSESKSNLAGSVLKAFGNMNAPDVSGVSDSISKAVESSKTQDSSEISGTLSKSLGDFPFKAVGIAAIGGSLATGLFGKIFGRSEDKTEEKSSQISKETKTAEAPTQSKAPQVVGAVDRQSDQVQPSDSASDGDNFVSGLLGKTFGRSKDDSEEPSFQGPEIPDGETLFTPIKESVADASHDSASNNARVDVARNPVVTDAHDTKFGDSNHDSKPESQKSDASPSLASDPGAKVPDKSLLDQPKVAPKKPAVSKSDPVEQISPKPTTPEPPAEPPTPKAVWIDKPLSPAPAKGAVSDNSKPSSWRSNRSPSQPKTTTSAPTVSGSINSTPTSTEGKTIIDAEWKKATPPEEESNQNVEPSHEVGNASATVDEKAETNAEVSDSSSDIGGTGASALDNMAAATSARDWSKAQAQTPAENKTVSPPPPLADPTSTSGSPRSSSTESARTENASTGDNDHSPREDESSKMAAEEKPETSMGAGMSYLDSMSANTAAPDWSKAKAPKTPDSPPPPSVSSPSVVSASSDSSAKNPPTASETTISSTSTSYLDRMTGTSTSAPDWSKAEILPPPESVPASPTGDVVSNPSSMPKVTQAPGTTTTTSTVTGASYLDSMTGSGSSVDWSKAKAPSPSESASVPAPPLSSSPPPSINPDTAKSKPTPKSEAPTTGAGVSYLDSMSASTASPDWSNWKAPETDASIPESPPQSTPEPSVPAANNDPSSISSLSIPDTATSTGTSYLDSMSASASPPDWSTAKAPTPPKNPFPVSSPPMSPPQAGTAISSDSDSVSRTSATPDWSRATTTTTPAPTPNVPPPSVTPRQKPPTGRPEYTEPIEIRLPNMGDTTAKIVKWYKKEGDFVEYKDLLCDIETEDFSFGVVNEDDVDGVMGKIAVLENSGSVSGNDLLCTLFHKESSGTKAEVPVPPVSDLGDSNDFAGRSSAAHDGNDYPIDRGGRRASDSIFGISPASTPDNQGYSDNSSASKSASDWSADIDEKTHEAPPSSYSEQIASSSSSSAEISPVDLDQSILEPIPILVPPMGKSRAKVARWYKKRGDFVEYNDLLCDIQTEEFTFGVAHESDVDAIMGGIEVQENADFIRYGDLLCTLMPLEEQKRRVDDEPGPNEPERPPYDPLTGSFTDSSVGMNYGASGFHASHGSGLGAMREGPKLSENSDTFEDQGASIPVPDWAQAKSTPAPGVSAQNSISTSLTSPGRQSEFSVPMPITMPHIGETKAKVVRWYKKEGDFVQYKDLLCDIETENFTFGVVNEDNVNGIMGGIAATKNSGAIGGGDLLCTLFHRKEDLADIGKADEQNAPRTMDSAMPPPTERESASPSRTGPVSPPWSSNSKNPGMERTNLPTGATSSAAFGLGSVPSKVSPSRGAPLGGGADTSFLDRMIASRIPKAKASSSSDELFAPPPSSAFEKDPLSGRAAKETNDLYAANSTPSNGLGTPEKPQEGETSTPATTGMSYLDSMSSNTAAIDWSKAGKVSPSSENSSTSFQPSTNHAGSAAEPSAFGLGSMPKTSQKAQPKASLSSNTSTMAGASYLDSMAAATSAPDWSTAKSPSSPVSALKSSPPPADPIGTPGASRSSSTESARTENVSKGDNRDSQLDDGPAKTVGEEKSETSMGAGMSYLDSMSTNAAAPDWSKAKAPKTPASPPASPPAAAPSSPYSTLHTATSTDTGAGYLDSMSRSSATPGAKAASPVERKPVTPSRTPAVGEGTTLSSDADVDSDDRLFKTPRSESRDEASDSDSVEQKGLSSNANMPTPTLSTSLEDKANDESPYDWSNSSSRSSFVDRVSTPKVNATSMTSVNKSDSDEPIEPKAALGSTEATTKPDSALDEGFVAPPDSKASTNASNQAEKAGPKKKSTPVTTEKQQKNSSAATNSKNLASGTPLPAKRSKSSAAKPDAPPLEKKIVAADSPIGPGFKEPRTGTSKTSSVPAAKKPDGRTPLKSTKPMKQKVDAKAKPTRNKTKANAVSSVEIDDKSTAKKTSKRKNGPSESTRTRRGKKAAPKEVQNGPKSSIVPKQKTSKRKRPKKERKPIANSNERPRPGKTGAPIKKSNDVVLTKSLTPLEKRFASEAKTTNIGADMLANTRNTIDDPVSEESVAPRNSDKVESKTPGENRENMIVADEKKAVDNSVAGTPSKSDSVSDSSTTLSEKERSGEEVLFPKRSEPEKSSTVSKSPMASSTPDVNEDAKKLPDNDASHAILDDAVAKSIKEYVKKQAGLISLIALEGLVESVKDYVLKQARYTAPVVLDDALMDSIKDYVDKQARRAEPEAAVDKPTTADTSVNPERLPPLEEKSITEELQATERSNFHVDPERPNETHSSSSLDEPVDKIKSEAENSVNPTFTPPDSMTSLEKRYKPEEGPEVRHDQHFAAPVAPNDTLDRRSPPSRDQSVHDGVNNRGSIPRNSMSPDSRPKQRPTNPFATGPIAPNDFLGRPPVRPKSLTPLERRYNPNQDPPNKPMPSTPVAPDNVPGSPDKQNTDPPRRSLTPLEQRHKPNPGSRKRPPNPFTVVPPAPDDVRPFSGGPEKPAPVKSLTPLERRYRSASANMNRQKTSGWIPPLADDRQRKDVTGNAKNMPANPNIDRSRSKPSGWMPPLADRQRKDVTGNAKSTKTDPTIDGKTSKPSGWTPPLSDKQLKDIKNRPEPGFPRGNVDNKNKKEPTEDTPEKPRGNYALNKLDETEPFS